MGRAYKGHFVLKGSQKDVLLCAGHNILDALQQAGNADLSPDEIADSCLLAGLGTVSDKEMPIMTSDFYTKHMLPAKPPGESCKLYLLPAPCQKGRRL